MDKLLALLNASVPPAKVKEEIVRLKAQTIRIKNPRNQRLSEMEPVAKQFRNMLNTLQKQPSQKDWRLSLAGMEPSIFKTLAESVGALVQENLFVPQLPELADDSVVLVEFVRTLRTLHAGPVETRNRFRRLFPPKLIKELSEELAALAKS